ncbi:MAG: hypothetical protein JW829_17245 [Pirellulales bacterium]|nr:hypothetical protein [Pirellulales bacterium]
MNNRQPRTRSTWFDRVWPGALFLTTVLGITGVAGACVAYNTSGAIGVVAVGLAVMIVQCGSFGALSLTACAGAGMESLRWHLGAMVCRFGFPFIAGILLYRYGGRIAEAGVFGWIVVFYLLALAVETPLATRIVRRAPPVGGRA